MKANRPVLVPRRPSVLPFGCQRVGCDRILLPLSPPGRKITSKRAGNPENVGLYPLDWTKAFRWDWRGFSIAALSHGMRADGAVADL